MKRIKQLTAIALAVTLTLTSARPARSNAIVVGDLVLVGTVVAAGILYYVWFNQRTHTYQRVPALESRKRPSTRNPDQGDLFERITTFEECRAAGGHSWKADAKLGRRNGHNLGRCYKKQGWF